MAVAVPFTSQPTRWRQVVSAVVVRAATRARRTSRVARARAGYAGGVAMAASGVAVQFGLGWALMAAGVVAAGSFLWLYDVDEART